MMRVYLDNCCFNRPFDEQNNIQIKLETEAKLHIQRLIADSKLELAWSFILDYENSRNPYKNRKAFVDKWEKLSKLYIEPTDEIILKSESFQKFGIKEKDSVHIACAIKAACNYFITTDYLILKKGKNIKEINILNPLEFITFLGGTKK